MKYLFNILVLSIYLFLVSCNSINNVSNFKSIDRKAEQNGFKKEIVQGKQFFLLTYQKIKDPKLPYVFYIEGDGRSFIDKYTLSNDPTPRNPILYLAFLDSRPNVIYLARPCQFLKDHKNQYCNFHYWSDKRMSKEVVESMNYVINSVSNKSKKIDLVGYSGGGGIAILLAVYNSNISSIVTIAGNLNHKLFCKYHNVMMMNGSLNPIDYAKRVNYIPQLHISGSKDNIVPSFIAKEFVDISNSSCVHYEIIQNATHSNGWKEIWPVILKQMPIKCY